MEKQDEPHTPDVSRLNTAPRCGAMTRQKRMCRGPAIGGIAGRRCRMHGGQSTGPRTLEGLDRSKRANLKHGHYSEEAVSERQQTRKMMKKIKAWFECPDLKSE